MSSAAFPLTYAQWHHCITVECGIPLTPAFIAERLAVWRNCDADETVRFRRLYGDDYLKAVIGWFELAEQQQG